MMERRQRLHLVLLGILTIVSSRSARAEIFSAVVGLKNLLQTEKQISDDILEYIKEEALRLENMRKIADDYKAHSEAMMSDSEAHLSNPINAFKLIKRFTVEWRYVQSIITDNSTKSKFIRRLNMSAAKLPTEEDLKGTAGALFRLQDTYGVSASQLLKGKMEGLKGTLKFTVNDCFELGQVAYFADDFYHCVLWMKQAMRLTQEQKTSNRTKGRILDFLSFSKYKLGEIHEARTLTIDWLRIAPGNIRGKKNLKYFDNILHKQKRNKTKQASKNAKNKGTEKLTGVSNGEDTFRELCRGKITPYKDIKLTCRLLRHVPLYYIRPLKEETMYLDPLIVVYHDIMVNSEIEIIKKLATPRLRRATVIDGTTQTLIPAQFRISKSAWLKEGENSAIRTVSNKVRWLANLTVDTAEPLQVVNYGIGGHYAPHYDHSTNKGEDIFPQGNRIATTLFYLSDVQSGGATVFTKLGIRILPIKGSCVLWYNLLLNGRGDNRTMHAGCPVLVGSKWVANKWIHERGQEFVRPCALDENI